MTAQRRRLAFVPVPHEGETLTSWLRVVADDLGRTPLTAAELVGLPRKPTSQGLTGLMWGLTDLVVAGVQEATGLTAADIRRLGVERYAMFLAGPRPGDGLAAIDWVRCAGISHRSSPYCPSCLADNGGRWLIAWRLPGVFMCPEHRLWLVDGCPGDDEPPQFWTQQPQRDQCVSPRQAGRGRCSRRFTDTDAAVVTDDRLTVVQNRVLDLLNGPPDGHEDLISLLTLARLLSIPKQVGPFGRVLDTGDAIASRGWDGIHSEPRRRVNRPISDLHGDAGERAAGVLAAWLLMADGYDPAITKLLGPDAEGLIPAKWLAIGAPHHRQCPSAVVRRLEPYRLHWDRSGCARKAARRLPLNGQM